MSAAASLLVLMLVAGTASTQEPPADTRAADTPEARAALPEDRLAVAGIDGVAQGFGDLLGPDGRAVCFAFLHPPYPLAQEYAPVLSTLAEEFAGQGIRLVGVVGECDDPAEVAEYRRTYGIALPIHLDTEFRLDATVTPEVVLVDRQRRIRYAGRIDDRYKVRGAMTPGDQRPERPTEPDLVAPDAVTVYKHVLPFLHDHCRVCHVPGQAGPFSLVTYDDAVASGMLAPPVCRRPAAR